MITRLTSAVDRAVVGSGFIGSIADRVASKVLQSSSADASAAVQGCTLGSCGCWSIELQSMVRVLNCSWGSTCTNVVC